MLKVLSSSLKRARRRLKCDCGIGTLSSRQWANLCDLCVTTVTYVVQDSWNQGFELTHSVIILSLKTAPFRRCSIRICQDSLRSEERRVGKECRSRWQM